MLKDLIKIFLFLIIRIIPKNKKLLVFGDRAGRRLADNSRYLFFYLNKHHKEFQCIWITKDKKIEIIDIKIINFLKCFIAKKIKVKNNIKRKKDTLSPDK